MNYKMIIRICAVVTLVLAGLLLIPAVLGLFMGGASGYFITAAICVVSGGALLAVKPADTRIYSREGLVSVGLSWIIMSLLGALPFRINGDIPKYIDALFETVSGLTTTGASILDDVEALSAASLFWRSFTHFIGGMGVLVFIMTVLPLSNDRNMHIMRAEVPGPTVGKLVPRMKKTAIILYLIYTAITLVEMVCLRLAGMSFFDALLHAFATAGTGGFSTRNGSIAAFNSPLIEMIIAFFLILFGINFNLYYLVLIGRGRDALKSEELKTYFGIIIVSTAVFTVGTLSRYGLPNALRHGFFNTMSLMSTAGFGTEDFTLWPGFTQALVILLMFCGGCAGSTAGGLKLSRVMMLFKAAAVDVRKTVKPHRVKCAKMDGKNLSSDMISSAYSYFVLYMIFLLVCMVLISFDGFDFTVNFTAALSCMSNVGPGLGIIGPSGNYNIFSDFSKVVMSVTMLFGRLEIYAMLILFYPSSWRRRG